MTEPGTALHNLGDLVSIRGLGRRLALVDLRDEEAPIELSAAEFDQRWRQFGASLVQSGVRPGDRVGFLSENRWEVLIGYLATMAVGAVAVPINYKLAADTVCFIVENSKLGTLFFDRERRVMVASAHVERALRLVSLDGDNGSDSLQGEQSVEDFMSQAEPESFELFKPEPGDLAEILYTSGSTGQPKGVPLDHHGQLWALSKYLEPTGEDQQSASSLIVAPLYHMNALFFSSVCLVNGRTIVLQPRFRANTYIEAVARYRCSLLSGVPTMFAMVVALGRDNLPADLSFVETIMVGSAPLSDALAEQIRELFPRASLSNGYGTTEAGPAVFGPHPEGRERPTLSIGFPLADIELRLIDENGVEVVGPGQGALEVKTPALTTGYLDRPDANAKRFEGGWYKTNDVMRRDRDGFFYFVSRVDDMFVCGGENIYPSEVEKLLNRHPSIQQSLVVAAPDDLKGAVPVAFVVPMPGHVIDEVEIRQFAIDQAPAYMHPRRVVSRQELPLGGTQKIDRSTLEREARELMVKDGRASR